jgi:AcrR family transcriptional regulator
MGPMSDHVKGRSRRAYDSPLRAEQARRTRRSVIEAARELYLAGGYATTTMSAVAARAGVATDTVYHLFGTKRGLLKEVLDVVVGSDDEDVALLDREGPRRMQAETEPRRQIELFAAGMTAQLERVRPLDDILRGAAAADAEVAALRDDVQLRQRREAMRTVAGWVSARGPLRDGMPPEHAADVLWTLTSPEVHHMLRVVCSWTPRQYERWLRTQLEASLLP